MKYFTALLLFLTPVWAMSDMMVSLPEALKAADKSNKCVLLFYGVNNHEYVSFNSHVRSDKNLGRFVESKLLMASVGDKGLAMQKLAGKPVKLSNYKKAEKYRENALKKVDKLYALNNAVLNDLKIEKAGIYLIHPKTNCVEPLTFMSFVGGGEGFYISYNSLLIKSGEKLTKPNSKISPLWREDFDGAMKSALKNNKVVLINFAPYYRGNDNTIANYASTHAEYVGVFFDRSNEGAFLYDGKFKERHMELLKKYYPDWVQNRLASGIILINPASGMEMEVRGAGVKFERLKNIIRAFQNGRIEYYLHDGAICYGNDWESVKEMAAAKGKKIVVLNAKVLPFLPKGLQDKYILFANSDDAKYDGKKELDSIDVFMTVAHSLENACIYNPQSGKYKIVSVGDLKNM